MTQSAGGSAPPNMAFLTSEPLLDAALAQIASIPQFEALMDSFAVAEKSGTKIPDSIRGKLETKKKGLHAGLIKSESDRYLETSGLLPVFQAKRKWDDVHFMAEAHGVGSSIPMVSYTGLSQEEMESGMNAFYTHLEMAKLNFGSNDKTIQKEVVKVILDAYKEIHETATGEFGGYEPFKTMVEHTPQVVAQKIEKKLAEEQTASETQTDTAMDYLTSQAQFP